LFHKEGDKNMKSRFLFVIFLSVLFLVSCGSDPNFVELTWQGTWISAKNYDERGTFTFNLQIDYEELSGTITIPGMGINNLEVVGTAEKEIADGGTDIDFSDKDNEISFGTYVGVLDVDSDTKAEGTYTNEATEDFGYWYCKYEDRKDFSSVSSFALDSSIVNPGGICFDGENLLVSDLEPPATIYEIDITDGTIISAFDISGIVPYPIGFDWDGEYFWDAYSDTIYKFDASWAVDTFFTCPGVGRLTYHEGYIWCIRVYTLFEGALCKVDPSNGNIENAYDFYMSDLAGFTSDGTNFWFSKSFSYYDWTAIYKVDTTGTFLETYNSPSYKPGALTFDGSFLYCIGSDINSSEKRIFKLGF
jgi:hypothetical protein